MGSVEQKMKRKDNIIIKSIDVTVYKQVNQSKKIQEIPCEKEQTHNVAIFIPFHLQRAYMILEISHLRSLFIKYPIRDGLGQLTTGCFRVILRVESVFSQLSWAG